MPAQRPAPVRAPGTSAEGTAVVIASAGRPVLLAAVLGDLQRQTVQGFDVVVSVPHVADLPERPLRGITTVVDARGAAAQRNAGMDACARAEHVFFFDDDAVVRHDYLERALAFFDEHPEVVGLTGRVLLDGSAASARAVSRHDAEHALAASARAPLTRGWEFVEDLYGCNFGFRSSVAPDHRFDERLPLYSWLEDLDFSRRLQRHGRLAKVEDCVIVHQGVKSGGRVSHERLGYSQISNPVYLVGKGTVPWRRAVYEIGPRLARNGVGSIVGAERSWRRRRLLGNARALGDVLRRRYTPERILDLPEH